MNKRGIIRFLVGILFAGTCQIFSIPQTANAGSVNFLTGGTVTIPYNEKFDPGTGAFTL
jgi:hypothetical protein